MCPAEDLVITTHALANFRLRASLDSVVKAVDEICRIFKTAKHVGVQRQAKGRSPGKRIRAKNKSTQVDVYQARDGTRCWTFYVRGRVLLTVHGPFALN